MRTQARNWHDENRWQQEPYREKSFSPFPDRYAITSSAGEESQPALDVENTPAAINVMTSQRAPRKNSMQIL